MKYTKYLIVLLLLLLLTAPIFASGNDYDSDGDKLSDEDERFYGTDPYNPDTDFDGHLDGHEIPCGWDPLDPFSPGTPPRTNNVTAPQDDWGEFLFGDLYEGNG